MLEIFSTDMTIQKYWGTGFKYHGLRIYAGPDRNSRKDIEDGTIVTIMIRNAVT